MKQRATRRSRRKEPTKLCTECKHARHDDIWGEFKCDILKRKIHHPEDVTDCVYHEKKDK